MAVSGQRAFVQKLSKQQAADVRRQVSGSTISSTPSNDGSRIAGSKYNSSHGSVATLTDVVEPPDYEDFVLQNQCLVERDPFRDRLLFPEDDIDVERISKLCRTVLPFILKPGAEIDHHVSECIYRFMSDYTTVNRRYQVYSSGHCCKDQIPVESLIHHEYEIDVEDACSEEDKSSKRQSLNMNDTPRGSWASSIFDLRQSQADALLPNLLERVSHDEVDHINESHRRQNRYDSIFSLYNRFEDEEPVEKRSPADVPMEHIGHRILVKCLHFSLELDVEPFFVSMTLYDSRERKKISETFHFDFNSEQTKRLIAGHVVTQDVSTLSRACIFSITYPSPDIFLVVRLEKVLQQGDIGESADPYIKEDKSAKEEKYRQQAGQFCERLGAFRMPFAWTAIHLMNIVTGGGSMERDVSMEKTLDTCQESNCRATSLDRRYGPGSVQFESFRLKRSRDDNTVTGRRGSADRGRSGYEHSWSADVYGASLESFRPVTLTVSSFFKQDGVKLSDEDVYKFLADLKRPSSVLKRLKCIPGTLKLDISPCPSEVHYSLTPELMRVNPYPDDKGRPVKEVIEFPSREVFLPATVYRNILYVYPRTLNFVNRQGSARNLSVKVQYMCGEDKSCSMPVIFGRSSCPEFAREAFTAVTYHNKCPDFYEEIKIKLPGRVSKDHHLLFTFYHISCQVKKMEPTSIEAPVGYTWLPLYKDGRLMTGEFSLPVSVEMLPAHYSLSHPEVQLPNNIRWLDNHKQVFTVHVKAVSSLHAQDEPVDRLMHLCKYVHEQKLPPRMNESSFENELKCSIMNVVNARSEVLMQFLHYILDKLIHLMIRSPVIGGVTVNVGQTTFDSLAQIVHRVHELLDDRNDHNGRNAVLASYIQYCFAVPKQGMVHQMSVPKQLGSPPGYNTLGRPSSLPISKANYQRSTSNPNLSGITPTSPDSEVLSFIGVDRLLDRSTSLMPDDFCATGVSRLRGKKLVHEELALQWVVSSGSSRELTVSNAWFFFELMVKAMGEYLSVTDRLTAPRQMRFPDHFLDDIQALVNMLIKDIIDRYIKDPPLVRGLNTSLAFFLQDLLSLMDRGFLYQMICEYIKKVSQKVLLLSDATSLLLLRLDFLRVVCSHEHFFPLNLPFATPIAPTGLSSPTGSTCSTTSRSSYTSTSTLTDKGAFFELTPRYRQQHYLVGLVLCDLSASFDICNPIVHQKAVNALCSLMQSHDVDVRYTDPHIKARLAALYLPVIGITMETLHQLFDPCYERKLIGGFWSDEEGDRISQRVAMAIAGSTICNRGINVPHMSSNERDIKMRKILINAETTRNLLMCFLWTLKNCDCSLLWQWWAELSIHRLACIVEVLFLAVSNFEYKAQWSLQCRDKYRLLSSSEETLEDWCGDEDGMCAQTKSQALPKSPSIHEQLWVGIQRKSHDLLVRGTNTLLNRSLNKDDAAQNRKVIPGMPQTQAVMKRREDMKSKLEEAILGTGNARTEMMLRRRQSSGACENNTLMLAADIGQTHLRWRKDQVNWRHSVEIQNKPLSADTEVDMHVEGSLAAEVSMIVLDTLELITQIAQTSDALQPLLSSVLRVLLHMLSLNQSSIVLQNLFESQRALGTKFLDVLFEEETEQCADLCLRLLRHCSSPISSIRSQSAASLYLLMRQNFELGNNFARVKMQVTMSLSSLVGQNQDFNEEYLRKSLKTILTYAEVDVELRETTFPEQVRDLAFNLHMILSDTVKMKEFHEDPEMLMDLMYRIAKGYQNSPDLRLTWLQNMAGKHGEKGNHAEAAQCLVHAAGLVAEYLNMIEDRPHLPVGCVVFQKISSNVLEESAVSDDVVSPDEGICSGIYFSESGLVGLLEQAASSFTMAGMYEAVNEMYKIMIPIHEHNRDFKKLAHLHQKLHEAFTNVIRQEGKRIFGTYFRVGFYGAKFGDLDGDEFVYKEQLITKLPEISHRLENFYADRFGCNAVQIIKDSNVVEREKLESEKAYIQITYVEPYFDSYEFKDRITFFEKNYNIKRFMYATPFTLDGRSHGELHEQYKRKTILTVCHSFPYIKTRLSVVERKQVTLSPVEVAIEDLMMKTKELATALYSEPLDRKILQMVLQGCIGTTVNQGPLEIALVFLRDVAEGKQPAARHHNKLRLCFKDFLKKCGDALHRNKSLISHDQVEYQRELVRNYHSLREKLQPMISTATVFKSKHHKRLTGGHQYFKSNNIHKN